MLALADECERLARRAEGRFQWYREFWYAAL
jgi:hypothetical protein